jgi:hypothetical protein
MALTATASRTRSCDARLLLARGALGDAGTLGELLAAARAGDRRWLRRIRRAVDPGMLTALAQTMALQEETEDALALYDLVRAALGPRALSPGGQVLHAQLAFVHSGAEAARRLLGGYRKAAGPQADALRVDLLNPFAGDRAEGPWRAAFQALLPAPGPVVGSGDGVPFDRLAAPAVPRVEAAHRISVVLTAYRPDRGLLTAVRSILAQSWANVEIVIVDDGSPPEYDEILRVAAGLGERVRLVRLKVNAGTYAARNAGLDAAGGEFAAFQDADDWSHPLRLETQVRPLLDDRRLVATTSDGLAVTGELLLTRPGVRSGRFNPSSLMLRRAAVLRVAGYFDRLRKAADSEYIGRIRAAFGADRVRHVDSPPLALIRLSANSLSRAEIKPHWMHPARTAYTSAYLRHHELIEAGLAPAHRPADGSRRPFPAPGHLRGADPGEVARYDVLMVADWRFLESAQRTAVDEMAALAAAGLRVAVLQLESYRAVHLKRQPLCAPVQDLVNAGVVDRVGTHERAEVVLVVVRQAAVLQFVGGEAGSGPGGATGIAAERVVVVADRAPVRGDGTDCRYVPADCAEAVRRLFGAEPVWAPQDPGVRALLRTEKAVSDRDFPTAIAPPGFVAGRTGRLPEPAVAGTDLCDAAAWPPDAADSLAVLRLLSGVDLRVRLPDRPELAVELPQAWLGYQAADVDARSFLHQLDFYLHFPPRESAEWYSRPALEAAAVGCVVVMPERYAGFYGDAAVYCGRSEVGPLIARYRADPGLFAEQSRRARSVVARAHDPALLVQRITDLLPVTAASTAALPMV